MTEQVVPSLSHTKGNRAENQHQIFAFLVEIFSTEVVGDHVFASIELDDELEENAM